MMRACRAKSALFRGSSNRRVRRPGRDGSALVEGGRSAAGLLRALLRPLLFLGVAAALAVGGARAYRWLTSAPHFMVRTIHVEGAARVTADEVRRRIGLEPATNIFRVRTQEVVRDVESHPWVKSATARRELPDALRVEVTEHQPRVAVLMGHLYLADADGRLFKRALPGEAKDLPVVTGLDRVTYLEDRQRAEGRIREALHALDAYRRPGRPRLSEISLDSGGGLTLYTYTGATQIRVGTTPLADAFGRLDLVLAALGPDLPRARTIHLDGASQRVAVRLSAEPEPSAPSADESMR